MDHCPIISEILHGEGDFIFNVSVEKLIVRILIDRSDSPAVFVKRYGGDRLIRHNDLALQRSRCGVGNQAVDRF